jgi:hypothetical protein
MIELSVKVCDLRINVCSGGRTHPAATTLCQDSAGSLSELLKQAPLRGRPYRFQGSWKHLHGFEYTLERLHERVVV